MICLFHILQINQYGFEKDKQLYKKVRENLRLFGAEKLIDKRVGNLSGGELQRVLLAIATTPVPNF